MRRLVVEILSSVRYKVQGMIMMRTSSFVSFLVAVMLILGLSGCAALRQEQVEEEKRARASQETTKEEAPDPAELRISAADDLLEKGDFEGSLKEDQKALALAGKQPPGDTALYKMGLIYVHYKNPNKNYEKAKAMFERLVREYPDSRLAEEAKVWAGVLQVIEKLKQVDIDIEERKKELSR